jgi:hypothetical protein
MSSDNQYTALGPAIVGFQTNSSSIVFGATISGTVCGVVGRASGNGRQERCSTASRWLPPRALQHRMSGELV